MSRLASITKAKPKKPVAVIHGSPGVGKTTFAAMAEGVIFIPTEDGMGNLSAPAFPIPTSFADVLADIAALYQEEHEYKVVVLDSLSALEHILLDQVASDNGKNSIEEIPYGKGYAIAIDYWRQFLDGMTALRNSRGMLPIMLAHTEAKKFDPPDSDSYERYVLSLNKNAAALIQERSDIIGYATHKVLVSHEKGEKSKGKKTGERLLHLAETPAYVAKNRYGMPDTIPFDWGTFFNLINQ